MNSRWIPRELGLDYESEQSYRPSKNEGNSSQNLRLRCLYRDSLLKKFLFNRRVSIALEHQQSLKLYELFWEIWEIRSHSDQYECLFWAEFPVWESADWSPSPVRDMIEIVLENLTLWIEARKEPNRELHIELGTTESVVNLIENSIENSELNREIDIEVLL